MISCDTRNEEAKLLEQVGPKEDVPRRLPSGSVRLQFGTSEP